MLRTLLETAIITSIPTGIYYLLTDCFAENSHLQCSAHIVAQFCYETWNVVNCMQFLFCHV
jgi:predicted secreted protein